MAKRKSISKQLRFEVFKRDAFRCQYCGKSAPEVILEVDHIDPVANGGTNDIFNLITSCRDCNRGKGKRLLSNRTVAEKENKYLEEEQARLEQSQMIIEWKKELLKQREQEIEAINDYIRTVSNCHLTESGKANIRGLIERFSFGEVYDATVTSFSQYYHGEKEECEKACNYIGGICWNRRYQNK